MSFSLNRDTEVDLAVWNEVSFTIFSVCEAIQANISVAFLACVCDVNFGYIVILSAL